MAQFNDSASIVPITLQGPLGEFAFFPVGTSTSSFFTANIADAINTTASYVIEFPTESLALQFRIPSESAGVSTDIIPLHITSSGEKPLIGFGTKTPQSTLDIRSITSSSPANILLRTNEDGVIQVGEETGRIEFAIESASFLGTDFVVSGSTAAIFSRVVESSAVGAIGNLIFAVNESSALTPIDAVVIGKGATSGSSSLIGMAVSGNIEMSSTAPRLEVRTTNAGNYPIARLGYNDPTDFQDGQLLLFNQGTQSVKFNGDAAPAEASFIRYGNLALGGTVAGEKLTVEGNISSSGDLISNTLDTKTNKLAVTSTVHGNHQGDVVFFGGTTSMDVGQIYNLNGAGGWTKAQANSQANSDALLAVALGAASDTNGMLLKGMVTLDHDPGTIGDPLYLSDGTAGQATSTAPNSTNDIVRLIGYCVDSTNGQIYFNPSNDFIVHA